MMKLHCRRLCIVIMQRLMAGMLDHNPITIVSLIANNWRFLTGKRMHEGVGAATFKLARLLKVKFSLVQ